ncbi:EamA family transporter [Paenibacillus turpanensis]|uniref:EamA family transporter n=1 Tax=Paenibacillus turpanensis TaxID=2689078 RepID=UPI00140AF194|nr:EamA family transporter [Paenibacillus turpanensis]
MWLVYAICAAVCFGLRGIVYQRMSKTPMNRSLFLFGVYVCGTIVALAGTFIMGQTWSVPTLVGIIMGVFSFGSNASMYKGFAVGKTSLVAMLTGLPAVVVALLAYLMWGETLTGSQMAAIGIILLGIIMIRYQSDVVSGPAKGAGWGLLAMITFAITDLAAKQSTLLGAHVLPTLTIMYATGALLFFVSYVWSTRGKAEQAAESAESEQQISRTKTFRKGLLAGTTNISGMIFILPAFKLGTTGLVSAVIAMNVVLILAYAWIIAKEPVNRKEFAGVLCSLVGLLVLKLAE